VAARRRASRIATMASAPAASANGPMAAIETTDSASERSVT
jgi:hypothetical protein